MHIETIAVHAGHDVDPATAAVTPPIHLSTTFAREADGSYRAGYLYSRYQNPNRAALEKCLAQLEGGAGAAAFASGSAATMTLLQAVGPGAHVILPDDAYFGTTKLARDILGPWGIEVASVDMTHLANLKHAMRPNTKLVWVETPSNPLLQIVDIAAVAEIAHRGGAICAVDNTWGTPVLQRPLDLGADVAMHSTTKYLGGHSDVLSGALVWREAGRQTLFASASVNRLEADERLFPFLERREETYTRLTTGVVARRFTVRQFAPVARVVYERNRSTVGLYDFERTSVEVGVERAF